MSFFRSVNVVKNTDWADCAGLAVLAAQSPTRQYSAVAFPTRSLKMYTLSVCADGHGNHWVIAEGRWALGWAWAQKGSSAACHYSGLAGDVPTTLYLCKCPMEVPLSNGARLALLAHPSGRLSCKLAPRDDGGLQAGCLLHR